jgi:hypothetical protein
MLFLFVMSRYDAIVVDVNAADQLVKVHFCKWSKKFDKWLEASSIKKGKKVFKVRAFSNHMSWLTSCMC